MHRDRHGIGEMIYLAEVRPRALADVIIDNSNFACPNIVRQRHD